MKNNLPVTEHEVEVPEGVSLVSQTDLQGCIHQANPAFAQLSGFTLGELQGQNHHIVRHPDMPAAVFKDMWQTLQSGKPWKGCIKNRCKNGDFYWVEASMIPIRRSGQIAGYISVCQRATAEAIAKAQALHATITNHGMPRQNSWPSWWGIRSGMRLGTLFVALMMLAGGALGIGGLKMADDALSRIYHAQFEPVTAVGQIEAGLNALRAEMLQNQLQHHNAGIASDSTNIEQLQNHYEDIDELFLKLESAQQTASDAQLIDSLKHYVHDGMQLLDQATNATASGTATTAATESNNTSGLVQQLLELERKASLSAQALRHSFSSAAEQEFTQTLQRNAQIRQLAIIGIALGLLAVVVIGSLFIRGIVHPLNAAIRQLNRIAEGDLSGNIELAGTGETARLNQAATVMQLQLKVMLDAIALAARSIHQHCKKLNASLYEVTEHTEGQHDQVYAAIRALDAATAETRDLSVRAEHLLQMEQLPGEALRHEIRDLATATRLTAFGADEVAAAMQQVGHLIVENRGQTQLAWQASEELMHTAGELNNLVDFFDSNKHLN